MKCAQSARLSPSTGQPFDKAQQPVRATTRAKRPKTAAVEQKSVGTAVAKQTRHNI